MDTPGSQLVIFRAQLYTRQFTDTVRTVLSPLLKNYEQEYMFVTLPTCIVEHVYPKETWCSVDRAKVLSLLRPAR